MKDNLERIKTDLKRLHTQGVNLLNAIRDEQFPEQIEQHFTHVLKKNYHEFKKGLPAFKSAYQSWYSEAYVVVKLLLPLRLNDFVRFYEKPKTHKEINRENYVIEDYLSDMVVTLSSSVNTVLCSDRLNLNTIPITRSRRVR